MKICDLINCSYEIDVTGVVDDSRNVKTGFCFVATKGFNVDHYDYIDDAIKNGASVIVADRDYACSIPVVVIDNVNEEYINMCSKFYNVSPDEFNLIMI